jgi:hypothetical protein
MKLFLTVGMLCGVICAGAQNTPPHAASDRTFTFDDQVWSDAIRIPECNKTDFTNGPDTPPDCRSYTDSTEFYYYNWSYLIANHAELCPPPWRMPSHRDWEKLSVMTTWRELAHLWGYGGYALGSRVFHVTSNAFYWSTSESKSCISYEMYTNSGALCMRDDRFYGLQVRCVKN